MGNVPQDNMTCSHIINAGIYRNDGQPVIENDTDYNKYSCVQCNPPSRIQVKENDRTGKWCSNNGVFSRPTSFPVIPVRFKESLNNSGITANFKLAWNSTNNNWNLNCEIIDPVQENSAHSISLYTRNTDTTNNAVNVMTNTAPDMFNMQNWNIFNLTLEKSTWSIMLEYKNTINGVVQTAYHFGIRSIVLGQDSVLSVNPTINIQSNKTSSQILDDYISGILPETKTKRESVTETRAPVQYYQPGGHQGLIDQGISQNKMICNSTAHGIYRNDGQDMRENDNDLGKYSCVKCDNPLELQLNSNNKTGNYCNKNGIYSRPDSYPVTEALIDVNFSIHFDNVETDANIKIGRNDSNSFVLYFTGPRIESQNRLDVNRIIYDVNGGGLINRDQINFHSISLYMYNFKNGAIINIEKSIEEMRNDLNYNIFNFGIGPVGPWAIMMKYTFTKNGVLQTPRHFGITKAVILRNVIAIDSKYYINKISNKTSRELIDERIAIEDTLPSFSSDNSIVVTTTMSPEITGAPTIRTSTTMPSQITGAPTIRTPTTMPSQITGAPTITTPQITTVAPQIITVAPTPDTSVAIVTKSNTSLYIGIGIGVIILIIILIIFFMFSNSNRSQDSEDDY